MILRDGKLRVMTIDCCWHILEKLQSIKHFSISSVRGKDLRIGSALLDVKLIAIGPARFPIRRLFISQLRQAFPNVPFLIFRREPACPGSSEECIRCEFILSDRGSELDCEIVQSLRDIMPFDACDDLERGEDYEIVSRVVNTITDRYSDPALSISKVARIVKLSPKKLSVILNQHVGVSFRYLLRQVRIEHAKRMLTSRQYSVKEVAVRVGFTDSHYFSRNFKEYTGQNASDFQEQPSSI